MNLELINSIACGLIALWATWCVLSGRVRDGILGKLIYSAIAISGFVVMTRNQNIFFGPTTAGLTLHVSLALAGLRHIFIVYLVAAGEGLALQDAELPTLHAL